MDIRNGDTHHAKASPGFFKTIPVLFIAISIYPNVKTALKGARFQVAEGVKEDVKDDYLEAFADCL
jgi:hypothetical protein